MSRCVGIFAQIQQQLLLVPEIKKFTLDRSAIPSPSLRFPQPVLLQDLLDARHTHYLMPSLRQSLLNRFQFPDPFPQNDQQNLGPHRRGDLPMTFGPTALRHQSPHSLAGKFREVPLHRIDMPTKRGRQLFLGSQAALV